VEKSAPDTIQAIAIGASLGGPAALAVILSALPATFPVPLFIVQHITAGFAEGLVKLLAHSSALKIDLAHDGQQAQRGHVYIAPAHAHMEVTKKRHIQLSANENNEIICPSVSRLFFSMAHVYGASSVGVLLTGMGKDGAAELLRMRQAGAVTVAQDEETSVMFGMPHEAILLGAAQYILPITEIPKLLIKLLVHR
jgi:two-component system chemotaxis response regulator CheB